MSNRFSSERLVAESLGTAFLLAAVVGSGIMVNVSRAETARLPYCATRFPPALFSQC